MTENYTKMLSREGDQVGQITNLHCRKCQLECCPGWRIRVKWPDGKVTLPCELGCKVIDDDTLQII